MQRVIIKFDLKQNVKRFICVLLLLFRIIQQISLDFRCDGRIDCEVRWWMFLFLLRKTNYFLLNDWCNNFFVGWKWWEELQLSWNASCNFGIYYFTSLASSVRQKWIIWIYIVLHWIFFRVKNMDISSVMGILIGN